MIPVKKFLLFLALLAGSRVNAQPDSLFILAPRANTPMFTEPGSAITVEVSGAESLPAEGWSAILKNDLREWPAKVKSASRARINHATEEGWRIEIVTAAGTSPELMELDIRHRSGPIGISPRSVSVVPKLESNFYILQQSDQHLTLDKAAEPGGKSSTRWGNGSKEALQWITPIVNLVNPRFILHTGDNMHIYNEAQSWCGMEEAKNRVKRFLNGISGYTAPTVIVTGNHDIGFKNYMLNREWRDEHRKLMGQKAFSFRMGSFYVLASEWTNTESLEWARNDLAEANRNKEIAFRLLTAHFYEGPSAQTTVAVPGNPCNLMLVGHNHVTRTLQTEPYYVLSTGTAQDHQRASFFNFTRTADGWTSEELKTHAENVNVHRLVGDHGTPTVSAAWATTNDGTSAGNTVTVTNTLPQRFYDGRVRFLLKPGKYNVSGGTVLSQYATSDGKRTAILVKVDIPKNGSVAITAKRN